MLEQTLYLFKAQIMTALVACYSACQILGWKSGTGFYLNSYISA